MTRCRAFAFVLNSGLNIGNMAIMGKPVPDSSPPVMTADELSAYLRINRRTLYRLLKKHPIPSFRVGSNHRFDRQAIDDWVRAQELQPALPAQELEATLPTPPSRRGPRPRVAISRSSS
jgi:excisionase family DNA binding protein